jgi:N-acetylmuramoyl-L-alanine amidase CwlA
MTIRAKKKIWNRFWMVTVPLLAVAGVLLVIFCLNRGETPIRERDAVDAVDGVPLHVSLLPEGAEGRPGTVRRVKYVVIHETGNPAAGADAASHNRYLLSGNAGTTSWHYTVDDHEIYQNLPDTEVGWHAGDREKKDGGNANGIGVELCINEDGDFEKTLKNGASLTAYLLRCYGLTLDDVKQHADFMEKDCPQTLRDTGRWQEFLSMVQAAMERGV